MKCIQVVDIGVNTVMCCAYVDFQSTALSRKLIAVGITLTVMSYSEVYMVCPSTSAVHVDCDGVTIPHLVSRILPSSWSSPLALVTRSRGGGLAPATGQGNIVYDEVGNSVGRVHVKGSGPLTCVTDTSQALIARCVVDFFIPSQNRS